MNQPDPIEHIIHYYLDILRVAPGKLPERAINFWPLIFQVSSELKLYYYTIYWVLNKWPDSFPPETRFILEQEISKNKIKNALLITQIKGLAEFFNKSGIPSIFIKGSAGLIRDIYPDGLRYLSDIDIIIPLNKLDETRLLLESLNYHPDNVPISRYHHHIVPYYNPDETARIEIHHRPYGLSLYDRSFLSHLWENSEIINIRNISVRVPSITDHVWILMRTDLIGRCFLPRLSDANEIIQILAKGYPVDSDLLYQRAQSENIQNLIDSMTYIMKKFWGVNFKTGRTINKKTLFKSWELWSLRTYQKFLLSQKDIPHFTKRFGALYFLPSKGIIKKIKLYNFFFNHEILYEYEKDRSIKIKFIIKFSKLLKDFATYLLSFTEYIWIKFRNNLS